MPTRPASLALAASLVCLHLLHAEALTWRIFSTTSDCVTTHVPDVQWSQAGLDMDLQADLSVELAFQASEVRRSNKSPALVDTWLLDAKDNIVFERAAISDLEDTFTLRGGQGPWRLCFQQRTDHGGWRPSAEIQLDAFHVHLASFRGSRLQADLSNNGNHTTSWRYMMDNVENLPTSLHVGELYESLLQLDQQLQHVGSEQKHLQHRTDWHLSTMRGTQRTMLVWSILQVLGFLASAGLQIAFIRMVFSTKGRIPLYAV